MLLTLTPSPRWKREVLPLAIPPRLLAPQRSHDDLQQRTHPRPRQRRHPRVKTHGLALVASRAAHVWLGRFADEVLSARDADHLVGRDFELDCQCCGDWDLCVEDAETVCGYGC